MLRMATKTRLSPEDAIKHAVEFFGPDGYGLRIREQSPEFACFEGAGGEVEVFACAEEKGSSLELVSREWDYQVEEFVRKLR